MKIAVIIVRVLMGLLFVFSAVVVLFNLVDPPALTGKVKEFNDGLVASGYFMTMLKSIELICGVGLILNLYVRLILVILFPIIVNILVYHAFLAPESIAIALLLMVANLFLAYQYRESYKPLFLMK